MNSILRSIGLYVKSSGFFKKNNNNNFVTQIKGKSFQQFHHDPHGGSN